MVKQTVKKIGKAAAAALGILVGFSLVVSLLAGEIGQVIIYAVVLLPYLAYYLRQGYRETTDATGA